MIKNRIVATLSRKEMETTIQNVVSVVSQFGKVTADGPSRVVIDSLEHDYTFVGDYQKATAFLLQSGFSKMKEGSFKFLRKQVGGSAVRVTIDASSLWVRVGPVRTPMQRPPGFGKQMDDFQKEVDSW